MRSFMQIHRARVAAQGAEAARRLGGAQAEVIARMPRPAAEAAGLSPNTPMGRRQLSTFLADAIKADLAALKNLSSVERKEQFKRDVLLPRYRDYVKRLTEAGQTDPAIGYFLVWCFDAGEIEEGFALARWCLEHEQTLPEGFRSTLPFFLASQILGWAALQYKDGHSFDPYLSELLEMIEVENWDLPDNTRAEFYRLKGLAADDAGELAEAVSWYEKSLALGGKVQTKLNNAKKALEKLAAAAPAADAPAAPAAPAA